MAEREDSRVGLFLLMLSLVATLWYAASQFIPSLSFFYQLAILLFPGISAIQP